MLSGIASLLFGTSATEGAEPTTDDKNCHLKTRPAENDEWEIVDTSRGSSPQRMETDPMENLLIEHPSMSVYGQRGRPASTGVESESSDASPDEERMEVRPPTAGPVNHHRPPRRPLAVAARAGLLVHAPSVKSMQVSQQKQNSRKLGKKRMQRSNKVTQYECSNKHQRRKHYTLRSSGVNNNRKCCY